MGKLKRLDLFFSLWATINWKWNDPNMELPRWRQQRKMYICYHCWCDSSHCYQVRNFWRICIFESFAEWKLLVFELHPQLLASIHKEFLKIMKTTSRWEGEIRNWMVFVNSVPKTFCSIWTIFFIEAKWLTRSRPGNGWRSNTKNTRKTIMAS